MDINILLAFGAGILSFFSPCVLPLYPSYLSYITGISVDKLMNEFDKKEIRNRALIHTLFFIIGFSIVFVGMGFAASLVGEMFYQFQDVLRQIGGLMMIFMGLMVAGWLKLSWFMKEKRFDLKNKPTGYIGSSLVGISFAAGWTPCVGPILSAILALAASDPGKGSLLLTFYSIGFAIPFFIMSFFISSTKWIVRYSKLIMKIGGATLILVGILLFTGQMAKITVYLIKWFGVSWF